MEKRILSIVLTVLGFAGIVISGLRFMEGNGSSGNIIEVIIYLVVGATFLFAGLNNLVPETRKPQVKTQYSQIEENQ